MTFWFRSNIVRKTIWYVGTSELDSVMLFNWTCSTIITSDGFVKYFFTDIIKFCSTLFSIMISNNSTQNNIFADANQFIQLFSKTLRFNEFLFCTPADCFSIRRFRDDNHHSYTQQIYANDPCSRPTGMQLHRTLMKVAIYKAAN